MKHIRDGWAVNKVACDIIRDLDGRSSVWPKWEGPREALLKAASATWIPVEDLKSFLNTLPGGRLTTTDVSQRLRAFYEEPYTAYPNDELRDSCLVLYELEKAAGTDMAAIIHALQEHVELEEQRLQRERLEAYHQRQEEARIALEQRFHSGADCKCTPLQRSKELYCRVNGRSYRLNPTADKKWKLHRIASLDDDRPELIGTYRSRRDVAPVLQRVAYQP